MDCWKFRNFGNCEIKKNSGLLNVLEFLKFRNLGNWYFENFGKSSILRILEFRKLSNRMIFRLLKEYIYYRKTDIFFYCSMKLLLSKGIYITEGTFLFPIIVDFPWDICINRTLFLYRKTFRFWFLLPKKIFFIWGNFFIFKKKFDQFKN